MKCKTLKEFFTEFEKFRKTKKDIANKNNYYDYVKLLYSYKIINNDHSSPYNFTTTNIVN